MVIINSLVVMVGVALVFGLLIIYISKKFAVKANPMIKKIEEALPGSNDGACGFASCHAFAMAFSMGDATTDGCPVGGESVAKKLAALSGKEVGKVTKIVARVNCSCGPDPDSLKYEYKGIETCRAATLVAQGPKKCVFGCIGFADCVIVCPFDAIHIRNFGEVPFVEEDKCTGCSLCVAECPKNIIDLVPIDKRVYVKCSSNDKPVDSKRNCTTNSCIACRLCERACEVDAIHVTDFLAKIDYTKCTNCEACVKVCPTNVIISLLENE